MADTDGDKTQDATPHRRQQAREKGQFAHSQDLAAAVVLLVGCGALKTLGAPIVRTVVELGVGRFDAATWRSTEPMAIVGEWRALAFDLASAMGPLLFAVLVAAIAAHLLQVGVNFIPTRVAPDISRIDPFQGAKRMFSLTSLVRTGFGVLKLAAAGCVAALAVYFDAATVAQLGAMEPTALAVTLSSTLLGLTAKISGLLLLLALLDYGWQFWKHEQDLRMTSQEVREEMKELQGDPQIAMRRKQVQRQLAASRMQHEVPKADVVVTNPTELAVALRYDPASMAAPIVVAKGAGTVAARIRRLALENDVPIVERKPLAQALFKLVALGGVVPNEHFAAVAEVLAYVYRLKGKTMPERPGSGGN